MLGSHELKDLFVHLPIPAFVLDPNHHNFKIIDVNLSFLNLIKLKKQDVLNCDLFKLLESNAHSKVHFKQSITEIIQTNQPQQISQLLLHFDSVAKYWDISLVPLFDEDKKSLTHIFLTFSVSENQKVEKENTTNDLLNFTQELYRSVFEKSSGGIAILGMDGSWLKFNKQVEAITGFSKEELEKLTFQDITHPDDLENDLNLLDQLISGKIDDYQIEKRYINKNGEVVWILLNATLVRDKNKKPVHFISFLQDISQIKYFQEHLQKSEENYHSLFWENPDAVYSFDLEGKFIQVNPASALLAETTIEHLLSISFVPLIPEEDQDRVFQYFQKATLGETSNYQSGFLTTKGNKRVINVTNLPIIVNNEVIGVFGIAKDITEKLKSEELLINERNLLRSLIDIIPDAIFVKDLESRHLVTNKANMELLGATSEEELLNKTGLELLSEITATDFLKDDKEIFATGKEILNFEENLKTRKNESKWYITSKVPFYNHLNEIIGLVGISKDITEIKKRELKLKLMESVLENANDMVVITEADPSNFPGPKIVYVNDAFVRMTGYSKEEAIGNTPRMLQGEKTELETLNQIRLAINAWKPIEVEVLNYKKDGEQFWNNISLSPLADETGTYTHWIAVQRDITNKKSYALQNELTSKISQHFNNTNSIQKSLKKVLKEFINYARVSLAEIWIQESGTEKLLLYSKKVKNKEVNLFYEDSKLLNKVAIGQGLPGVVWETKEFQHWSSDDPIFLRKEAAYKNDLKSFFGLPLFFNEEIIGVLILGSTSLMSNDQNLKIHFDHIGTFLGGEIKRKLVEQELDYIFKISPNIIVIAGFDGFFKKVNPAASKILGYTEKELLEIPYKTFVHPDDLVYADKSLKKLVSENKSPQVEIRFITKTKKIVWLAWTPTPDLDHRRIIATATDITLLKKNKESLEKLNKKLENRAQDLAVSNAELEQFAYVASHDLQEPLRMISSFLSRLEIKYGDQLDDKAKNYIQFASSGAQQMRQTILDLLEYSRVGKDGEKLELVNIKDVIVKTEGLLRKSLEESNAKIIIGKMPTIHSQKLLIKQLFQNIISNSIKYKQEGQSPIIEISYIEGMKYHQFAIADNGIGIEEDYFDKIFIMFNRLHHNDQISGTGIGLAICKKIVDKLGGSIWVESELGKGSVFYFKISKENDETFTSV
ncbi:PAS domain S-box protein [Belliella aquatica]|uniref:histidine kinase n=1 Tax=Belliella aquatica TaxID=1323734 RepID=A0ABQ1MZ51_9BACT|nr:PAS domain S-box protein [Belliella aquatica]MCH7407343.1 PAS domain S-box protein [Belliella aquatica]GGC49465.1 hypothetical protein GCM10010993_29940 [Belliella aquatica]